MLPLLLRLLLDLEDVMLEGRVATLLDLAPLALLMPSEEEVADLSSSLLLEVWPPAAACEADASVEPRARVSSAPTDDDLADLVVEVDEDSVATLSDLPLRLEGGDLSMAALDKAASAPRREGDLSSLDEIEVEDEEEEEMSALPLTDGAVVADPDEGRVATLLDLELARDGVDLI